MTKEHLKYILNELCAKNKLIVDRMVIEDKISRWEKKPKNLPVSFLKEEDFYKGDTFWRIEFWIPEEYNFGRRTLRFIECSVNLEIIEEKFEGRTGIEVMTQRFNEHIAKIPIKRTL